MSDYANQLRDHYRRVRAVVADAGLEITLDEHEGVEKTIREAAAIDLVSDRLPPGDLAAADQLIAESENDISAMESAARSHVSPTRRHKLSRQAGWRKPPGSISVARGSGRRPFANPYRVGDPGIPDRAAAVRRYREKLRWSPNLVAVIRRDLAGRDLLCWCPLDEPCHADVLLRVARGEKP